MRKMKEQIEKDYIIRCNNCMEIFEGESDLALIKEPESEFNDHFNGCPNCQTDDDLMDIFEDEEAYIEYYSGRELV